jgi:hypothetical protein
MKPTLAQQGYRMPAEFEPHEATWLAWPHNPETWPGRIKFIPPIFQVPDAVRKQLQVRSANFALYGDVSARIVTILRDQWKRFYSGQRELAATAMATILALLTAGLFEYNFGDSEVLMLFLTIVTLPAAAARPAA